MKFQWRHCSAVLHSSSKWNLLWPFRRTPHINVRVIKLQFPLKQPVQYRQKASSSVSNDDHGLEMTMRWWLQIDTLRSRSLVLCNAIILSVSYYGLYPRHYVLENRNIPVLICPHHRQFNSPGKRDVLVLKPQMWNLYSKHIHWGSPFIQDSRPDQSALEPCEGGVLLPSNGSLSENVNGIFQWVIVVFLPVDNCIKCKWTGVFTKHRQMIHFPAISLNYREWQTVEKGENNNNKWWGWTGRISSVSFPQFSAFCGWGRSAGQQLPRDMKLIKSAKGCCLSPVATDRLGGKCYLPETICLVFVKGPGANNYRENTFSK